MRAEECRLGGNVACILIDAGLDNHEKWAFFRLPWLPVLLGDVGIVLECVARLEGESIDVRGDENQGEAISARDKFLEGYGVGRVKEREIGVEIRNGTFLYCRDVWRVVKTVKLERLRG